MKTIIRNGTNVSLYLFDDATEVVMTSTETTVGNPAEFIISDCNTSNATLYTGVTDPEGWAGWKYLFDGTAWALNPGYIPPPPPAATLTKDEMLAQLQALQAQIQSLE